MSMTVTLSILGVALVLGLFANWKSRQPYEPGKLPLLPYTGIMFVCVLITFLMLGHLITLLTGEPFKGRRMP